MALPGIRWTVGRSSGRDGTHPSFVSFVWLRRSYLHFIRGEKNKGEKDLSLSL